MVPSPESLVAIATFSSSSVCRRGQVCDSQSSRPETAGRGGELENQIAFPKPVTCPLFKNSHQKEIREMTDESIIRTQQDDIWRRKDLIVERRTRVARRLQAQKAKLIWIGLAISITDRR